LELSELSSSVDHLQAVDIDCETPPDTPAPGADANIELKGTGEDKADKEKQKETETETEKEKEKESKKEGEEDEEDDEEDEDGKYSSEEEEVPEDLQHLPPDKQRIRILWRSAWMMGLGTIVTLLFSDPMVDVMAELGHRMTIPAFYVAFVLAPIASNASELIASINYAKKKTKKLLRFHYQH